MTDDVRGSHHELRAEYIEDKKPKRCNGCGLRLLDGHRRAPHETDFDAIQVNAYGSVVFRCVQCRTRTQIPLVETRKAVDCRNCGKTIPEDLQGNHVCETHPLGLATEPSAREETGYE